jgi:hypothetical protein
VRWQLGEGDVKDLGVEGSEAIEVACHLCDVVEASTSDERPAPTVASNAVVLVPIVHSASFSWITVLLD